MNYKRQLLLVLFGVAIGWLMHGFLLPGDKNEPQKDFSALLDNVGLPHVDVREDSLSRKKPVPENSLRDEAIARNNDAPRSLSSQSDSRELLLARVRNALSAGSVTEALALLAGYLESNYNDVDALRLKSEILAMRHDYKGQIDALYTAKSYAWQEEVVSDIQHEIRSSVDSYRRILQTDKNHAGLMTLFQDLVYLEPDYSPYFIELAAAQSDNNQPDDARQSLLLVKYDATVGEQARRMLKALNTGSKSEGNTVAAVEHSFSIPLQRKGNHFIVDAVLNDNTPLRLIIDTGASLTIIKPGALPEGVEQEPLHSFNTANGIVRAPVIIASSLTIGEFEVSNLKIGGLTLDTMAGIDGLLGMNFLKHFRFFIDQQNNLLRLSMNENR